MADDADELDGERSWPAAEQVPEPVPLMPTFVAIRAESAEFDHWQGGENHYTGADCLLCRRPLLLIWDLNAGDPRFECNGIPVFQNAERLPLFYCWRCCIGASYRIEKDRIRYFSFRGEEQGDDFPYRDYPEYFPRAPLRLSRRQEIDPRVIECVDRIRENDVGVELSDSDSDLLSSWLGRRVKTAAFDLWWHQVGGEPFLYQGVSQQNCPNVNCPAHAEYESMKLLAVVKNDPLSGLPMLESLEQVNADNFHSNSYVSLVYYVCTLCNTIRVEQDCT